MNRLVSVIIPCYNGEHFIAATLDSVLNQTYHNIEIIVIDDGSTDGTRRVLSDYSKLIKVASHQGDVNRGQPATVNLGLSLSKGEYIAILDYDDLWEPNKIESQVELLSHNPSIGMVYANGYAIDEHNRKLYELIPPGHRDENNPERLLLDCSIFLPSASLIRHSVFLKIGGYDEDIKVAADHDMLVRVAEATTLAYIKDHLWSYRRHQGSLSHAKRKQMWQDGFKVLAKACKRANYSTATKRKRLAVLNYRLGQCLLKEKDYPRAILRFAASGALDPVRAIRVLLGVEEKFPGGLRKHLRR